MVLLFCESRALELGLEIIFLYDTVEFYVASIHFLVATKGVVGAQTMLAASVRSATRVACRRREAVKFAAQRAMSSGKTGPGPSLPFGLDKILGEPDNLIATDRERKSKIGTPPDFLPPEVKKDMEELGLDDIHDLDELEEKNMEGYNDLGLVPPEGAGSFASPILIPSRMDSRVVGYQDPETHAMFWFNIHNDNNSYYIKDLGLFFKMLHIPDEEAQGAH